MSRPGSVTLGPVELRTPLIAASGTVGSVVDAAGAVDFSQYGAAVAKSVAGTEWQGRPAPRLSPTGVGMLNGIGIQNPGIDAWVRDVGPRLDEVDVPVWGSAVGETVEEFARVAEGLERAGVTAVEVNLSCPNLEEGTIWAFDPDRSADVIAAVRGSTSLPVGAKLSPNAERIPDVAERVLEAGADWLVLTNTALGAAVDLGTRQPALSGVVGGYSGAGMKPMAMRCVLEVRRSLGDVAIVGCGGVRTGLDVIEYVMAGARAVAIGTGHFERPRIARRILRQAERWMRRNGVDDLSELVGVAL
ncbi:MAG: dihydroorotate dehydrogenase [Acidimicrobiia bacterium]|nr:dihydroorotate dehydrogenase [Acidimicrobiia bacterium]